MPANDPLTDVEVLELVQQDLCPRCAGEVTKTYPPKDAETQNTLYSCASCSWTEQDAAQRVHDA